MENVLYEMTHVSKRGVLERLSHQSNLPVYYEQSKSKTNESISHNSTHFVSRARTYNFTFI